MPNTLDTPDIQTLYKFCMQNIQNESSILLNTNLYSSDSRYPGALCVAIKDSYEDDNKYHEALASYWCALHGNNKYRYSTNKKKNFIQKQARKWLGEVNHVQVLDTSPKAATKLKIVKLNYVVEYKSSEYSSTRKLGTVLTRNRMNGKTFVSVYSCDAHSGWSQTSFKFLSHVYVSQRPVEAIFDFVAKYAPQELINTLLMKAPHFNNVHHDYLYNSYRAVNDYYKLRKKEIPPVVLEMVKQMELSFTDAVAWIESSKTDDFKNSDVMLPEFEF